MSSLHIPPHCGEQLSSLTQSRSAIQTQLCITPLKAEAAGPRSLCPKAVAALSTLLLRCLPLLRAAQLRDTPQRSFLGRGGGSKETTATLSKHQRGFDQQGSAEHRSPRGALQVHRQAASGTWYLNFLHCDTGEFV